MRELDTCSELVLVIRKSVSVGHYELGLCFH